MKKGLTTLLVILLAVGAMLVSCKAEVATPADELVSASFELDSSRALSATLDDWKPETYYWKYAAKKNAADTSGLTSGTTTAYTATGAEWVKVSGGAPVAGLAGHIVPNFSQGLWDFQLFAYKLVGSEYKLIYQGEAKAVTLVKGGTNMVHVVVSPLPTGNGTLVIGATSLTPRESTDVPTVSRFLKVEDLDGHEYAPTSGTTYNLAAGAYKVTVTFKTSGIVYAEGTVIATVYPNMTTTVTGTVDELVTYAQFVAEQNPDIITRTAGVDGITSATTGDDHGNINLSEPAAVSDKKVSATVPAAAAVAMLPKKGANPDPNASMALELNVDTTDSTSTSVTYEISMTKIVTLDSEVTTSEVTDLGKDAQNKKYYATAMVQLSKGLTGVSVTHNGNAMVESTDVSKDDGNGIYSYDADSGILTIITNTFSPFAVTYDGQTAGVAELNGKKYATLVAACNALPEEGGTITLLSDAEGAGLFLPADRNMEIVLDLNKHTYTCTGPAVGSSGTESQALHLEKNNSVTIKNGTITSESGSGVKMLVQNYCDLTLEDVVLDGRFLDDSNVMYYTLSLNQGNVVITGKTTIIAHADKGSVTGKAFDVWGKYSGGGDRTITFDENFTGKVEGVIEYAAAPEGKKSQLIIKAGDFTEAKLIVSGTLTDDSFIEISGGIFGFDPTAYAAKDCEIRKNSDGTWTVLSPSDVARQIAIDAGADPATIVVGYDSDEKMYYALGTLTDDVRYCFYTNRSVYVYNAKDYNGWDGESFDETKYTVGKLFASIPELTVVGLCQNSFKYNTNITSVAFANDITSAYKPFDCNSTVKSVDLTNLTRIPNRMFYNATGLGEVIVPAEITSIGPHAFDSSGMTSITVNAPVVSIADTAFAYCPNLKTIDIKGAATIGTDGQNNFVARACPSLTEIYIRDAGTTFIGNKSMTFTHEESGNDAGAGITLYVVNETVFNAMKEFSGDYIYSKMKVVYAN